MKTCYVFLAAGLAASVTWASGVTYTIKDGASNWAAASSFKDAASAPGEDDIVVVPAHATVYLNCSTDAASFAIVKKLRNIFFTSDDSRFEISVGGSDEVEIPVSMTAFRFDGKTLSGTLDYTGGPIVKKGTGTLHLSSSGFHTSGATNNNVYDYYATICVEEGTLKVQQDYKKDASALGRVTVKDGATFFVPYTSAKADGGSTRVMSFSGAGTVTNDHAAVVYFCGKRSRGDYGVFSGSLGGPLKFAVNSELDLDAQALTGVSWINYSGSDVWNLNNRGRLAYGNLATANNMPTAFGYYTSGVNIWLQRSGFTLEYVGDQEFTTVQPFVFQAPGIYPVVFDGGWHGGVTFNGQWQRMYSTTGGQGVVLTGSNTVACVLNNNISDNTESANAGGRGHTLYISKEGTGTWFMKNPANDVRKAFASGISINEGILQYDTLAQKGQVCALGVGTNLTDGVLGTADTNAEHRVSYGVRFGAPTLSGELKTSGRLEYVTDTVNAFTTNREFGVDGTGGFLANNAKAAIVYAGGVYSVSTNDATLCLDGTGTVENVVLNVADGTTPLSILKEGSGTWALGGDLAFTGDITVKGGTLLVRKPTHYTWYRWTVTGLWGTTENAVQYHELGFFDKDGNNQVLDTLECKEVHRLTGNGNASRRNYMALLPGTAQHHFNGNFSVGDGSGASVGYKLTLDRGFDGAYNGISTYGVKYQMAHPSTGNWCHPVQEDPSTWLPLTVRLREDAHEVTCFDFANVGGNWSATGGQTCISNCIVEASLDGIHWDTLTNMYGAARHYDGGMWSCQGGYTDGEEGTHTSRFPDSFPNRNPHYNSYPLVGHPAKLPTVLDPAGYVSVTGGGRLKADKSGTAPAITISKLRLDTVSGGTIDGFAFAADGTIDIVGDMDAAKLQLPVTVENSETFGNVTDWTVLRNGKRSSYTLGYNPVTGKLTVSKPGAILIVR